MTPKLVSAEYTKDFRVLLRFEDGREAEVDFEKELWGEVFEPLKDPDVFRDFKLDEVLNTITWPTGADFAPEILYERTAENGTAGDDASRRP